MFLVRAAEPGDQEAVIEAARHLNSVNLPHDPERLAQIVERSERSFAGKIEAAKREFMFVMVEREEGRPDRVLGVSMIFAQHGSRKAPHIFFDVLEEERYSETLDRHFRHKVLRIGYNYRGLTEIGGLVVLPQFRNHPAQLGKALAYVRFLYIALHRDIFKDEIVSELMPPLQPDGTSLLWEALGRNFTGLSYQEADQLSRVNKEFIRSLFPQDPIYTALLPAAAAALIGQVGPASKPVEKLLRRAGFSYADRIDPFDGGPHFHAQTDQITLVKETRRLTVRTLTPGAAPEGSADALVAVDRSAHPYFQAIRTRVSVANEEIALPVDAAAALSVGVGDAVAFLPLASEAPRKPSS